MGVCPGINVWEGIPKIKDWPNWEPESVSVIVSPRQAIVSLGTSLRSLTMPLKNVKFSVKWPPAVSVIVRVA